MNLFLLWWNGQVEDELSNHSQADNAENWSDAEENFISNTSLQMHRQTIVFLQQNKIISINVQLLKSSFPLTWNFACINLILAYPSGTVDEFVTAERENWRVFAIKRKVF